MIDINYEYMYRRAKVAYRLLRMFVRSYRRTDGETNYAIGVASLLHKQLLYKHPGCARQGFPVTPQFCKNWCNDYSFWMLWKDRGKIRRPHKLHQHMFVYVHIWLCWFVSFYDTDIVCVCVCEKYMKEWLVCVHML